jgi:hypothetical protein
MCSLKKIHITRTTSYSRCETSRQPLRSIIDRGSAAAVVLESAFVNLSVTCGGLDDRAEAALFACSAIIGHTDTKLAGLAMRIEPISGHLRYAENGSERDNAVLGGMTTS